MTPEETCRECPTCIEGRRRLYAGEDPGAYCLNCETCHPDPEVEMLRAILRDVLALVDRRAYMTPEQQAVLRRAREVVG